ncbi:MAG: polysaccharide deacetylase family protein [bacterium]
MMVILYIRHWANRKNNTSQTSNTLEGTYFRRYLPPVMFKHYSETMSKQSNRQNKRRKIYQVFFSILTVSFTTSLIAGTIYINKDKFSKPIDLTEQEIKNITLDAHQWQKEQQQTLPDLSDTMEKIKAQGITVLKYKNPSENSKDSVNNDPSYAVDLNAIAEYHWDSFVKKHDIKLNKCYWQDIEKCRKLDSVLLVLPDHWHIEKIDSLLNEGKHVLLYGFPKQLSVSNEEHFTFQDLTFEKNAHVDSRLSLVGDQLLTLGFDAGLILDVKAMSNQFVTKTETAQAISISDKNLAGGKQYTRLFAKSNEQGGRLVWMDFSPNKEDHAYSLNLSYFNALIASIFRFLDQDKPTYQAIAMWPQGKKFAALLEEDTEDQYYQAERVAEYFGSKQYPITWYVLSNHAQQYKTITRLLAETGEMACHGDNHQPFTLNSEQQQHIRLARCKKVVEAITNQTVYSFRPPEERHDNTTLDALANNNFGYFIGKTAVDRFVPQLYKNKEETKALVSMPRMSSDDYALWNKNNMNSEDSINTLKHETDWVEKIGGLFMFSFHTQFMGNDDYFNTVTGIADYIAEKPVYFALTSEIGEWWKVRAALQQKKAISSEQLKKYQPVTLKVGKGGQLQRSDALQAGFE